MGSEGLHERYVNPYTDFAFKLLFGTELNKDLLISFLNALLHGEEVIENVTERLFRAAEIANFNKRELVEYEDSLKNYRDWYSVMETAQNKGLAKGLAEGLAEGLAKGKAEGEKENQLKIARTMKADGIPIDTIAKYTSLSSEEIASL